MKSWFERDLENGFGMGARADLQFEKYSVDHGFEWKNQYVFQGVRRSEQSESFSVIRGHISSQRLQRAVKQAGRDADILKNVTCHSLRYSFATHLLQNGTNIREIQELLGLKDIKTTMIYTHVDHERQKPVSPADTLYSSAENGFYLRQAKSLLFILRRIVYLPDTHPSHVGNYVHPMH